MSWLKAHRKYAEISLVCSGKEDDSDTLYGLNELSDEQLLDLYSNKVALTQDDIEYADYIWQLYCSDNPIRLENLSDFGDFQFHYLSDALQAHLRRFPAIKNGLNEVETHILKLSVEHKPKSKKQLLGTILKNQGIYGFGAAQFERIISTIKPLYTGFNPVRLSKKGKDILEGSANYYSAMRENNQTYLGGALKYNYLYNTDNNKILKL